MVLLFDKIMCSVIWVIAIILLREIYIAKDGWLRIILLWYFAIEVWIYGATLWFLIERGNIMKIQTLHLFEYLFIPKFLVKIGFYIYIVHIKKRDL